MYSNEISSSNTKIKLGVGIIICDESGRVLLEKRSDNGLWGLPGGSVEPGETIQETAIREAKEETGFTISITGLVGIFSEPSEGRIATYPDNGDQRHLIDIVFTAKIESGTMAISSESLELRFFDKDSFPTEIVSPAKKPLSNYISGLSNAFC